MEQKIRAGTGTGIARPGIFLARFAETLPGKVPQPIIGNFFSAQQASAKGPRIDPRERGLNVVELAFQDACDARGRCGWDASLGVQRKGDDELRLAVEQQRAEGFPGTGAG